MRARPDRLTPLGTHDRLLRPAVLAAGSLLVFSTLLIALWVPSDRAEGFRQRIFYLHVPIALTAYLFLLVGAFYAARYLLRRDPMDDLRSYVAIHQGVIFGTLVLISGPIWAKVSWGIWWDWSDKQLNTFLLVFLFYCAYFMLRYSVDEGARRERFSAIYALLGIGMVPLSLAAVHLAGTLHHPTVFHRDGPAMEHSMFIAFLVSWAGFVALGFALWRLELRGKLLAQGVQRLEKRLRGEAVLP
jgi:heme exporter protein C